MTFKQMAVPISLGCLFSCYLADANVLTKMLSVLNQNIFALFTV